MLKSGVCAQNPIRHRDLFTVILRLDRHEALYQSKAAPRPVGDASGFGFRMLARGADYSLYCFRRTSRGGLSDSTQSPENSLLDGSGLNALRVIGQRAKQG